MSTHAELETPRPLGPGTLGRRLVLATTGLVAAVTVALSLFSALGSFQILRSEVDGRLASALVRVALGEESAGEVSRSAATAR